MPVVDMDDEHRPYVGVDPNPIRYHLDEQRQPRASAARLRALTLMFLTQEAVRLAIQGIAVGVGCDGCPPLPDLMQRYEGAGGRFYVCPICLNSRHLGEEQLVANAEVQGTIPMWEWIGDEGATTFSY